MRAGLAWAVQLTGCPRRLLQPAGLLTTGIGQAQRRCANVWMLCCELFVQVCRVAQGALRSDRKEQKLQETAERRRAGDKLAVPDPIYLIGRRWAGDVTIRQGFLLRSLCKLMGSVLPFVREPNVLATEFCRPPVHLVSAVVSLAPVDIGVAGRLKPTGYSLNNLAAACVG